MAEELCFELLGGIHITRDREPVVGFMSNKALALLCYLAVTGRPHQRDILAGLFWGELPEADARNNLRQAVANLRKLVGDHVEADRQTVAFNRALPHWLDVAILTQSAALAGPTPPADPALLAVAVELYRGDFLAGLNLREAPAFDEWLTVERERLRALAVSALAALIDHHTRRGDYPTAIPFARRLLGLDPWNEDAHRRVMLLLARTGGRSAALAQYETCRRLLADELGIEPAPDTVALYERLRSADSNRAHHLPAPATPLVGRDEELAALVGRLSTPDSRIVTVTGPGGIGKTRLALEAARRLRQSGTFLNGVYFVPLDSLGTPDLFVSTVAEACQFAFYNPGDPRVQLINYLRQKEMLLVLDNFEHLLDAVSLLADIARHAPEVKLLVTSRERLNLQGEWVLPLEGLSYPAGPTAGNGQGEGWEDYDAVKLFLQNAARIGSAAAPSADEKRAAAHICRLVEGMPLGIELASAWARTLSYAEIARQIEHSLDFLTTLLRDVPERQRSLRAIFEHSWGLLPDDERAIFLRLPVFQGGFTAEAAAMVAGASLRDLSSLADKSLVRRDAAGRYQIHGLLRQYADGKLRAYPEEFLAAQGRHSAYYAEFLRKREPDLKGARQKESLEEIAAEIENVRAGWGWAAERGGEHEINLSADGLYYFYRMRGHIQEGAEMFERAAEGLAGGTTRRGEEHDLALGKVWARQAVFCDRLGRYRQADDLLRRSLAALRRLDARGELAFTLKHLGDIARALGNYDEASRFLGESIQISAEVGDRPGQAFALLSLGGVAFGLGNHEKARRLCEEGLTLCREAGDRQGAAQLLTALGIVSQATGDYDAAASLLRDSLATYQELNDREGTAEALYNLALVARALGDHTRAKQLCQESLTVRREIGNQSGIADCLTTLGEMACASGGAGYHDSENYFHSALKVTRDTQETPTMLSALAGLAALWREQTKWEQALELAALIRHHPAAGQETKDRAGVLISELESQLPAPVAAVAQERGRARQLGEVVTAVLGEN